MKYFFVFILFLMSCSSSNNDGNTKTQVPIFKEIASGDGPIPDSLKKGDSSEVMIGGKKYIVYSSSSYTMRRDSSQRK